MIGDEREWKGEVKGRRGKEKEGGEEKNRKGMTGKEMVRITGPKTAENRKFYHFLKQDSHIPTLFTDQGQICHARVQQRCSLPRQICVHVIMHHCAQPRDNRPAAQNSTDNDRHCSDIVC